VWFHGRSVTDFLAHRLIARLAGWLFILGSAVLAPLLLLPGNRWNSTGALLIAAGGVGIGVVVLLLPWQRWPRSATLALIPIAFVLIAIGNVLQKDPYVYGIYYVLTFSWVGVAHPRWTSVKLLPLAVASYLVPLTIIDLPGGAGRSSVIVMAVSVLVGESLAWVASKVRLAENTDVGRMRSMESLLAATVLLARQTEPAQAADLVGELTVQMLHGAKAALVLLLDPAGGVRGTGAYEWPVPAADVHARWLDPPAREALATGSITRHSGKPLAGDLTHAAGGEPVLFVPLVGSSAPLGLIMATFESDADTHLDAYAAGLATTFATQAGLAFERLSATEQLLEDSMRDALTGIGNRRHADLALATVGQGDGLAMIDLDHFKKVNDRYGHAVGDRVLYDLAHFLATTIRDGDAVARFGGEEFLVVMKRVGDQALSTVERLAQGWRDIDPVTSFSAGVAIHCNDETTTETLARADAALYEAKNKGRNKVLMADDANAATAS
jgi:diguanylate cyclase (GGDEF)-like protein